jgi:hypothetical protein
MDQEIEQRVWYKEPYVWLVIAFPLTAVLAGIYTAKLAITTDTGLIRDDYYKEGLQINHSFARDEMAKNYGLHGTVEFKNEQQQIVLSLTSNASYKLPPEILLNLSHGTLSGFDQQLILKQIADGTYRVKLPKLILGPWKLSIENNDWRLHTKIQITKNNNLKIIKLGQYVEM